MQFILIPHVLNGQNAWERPKRAPKLKKIVPFPMDLIGAARPQRDGNQKKQNY